MYVEYCVWFLSPHLNNDITNQVRVQKIATIGITSKMWKELHTSDSRKKKRAFKSEKEETTEG